MLFHVFLLFKVDFHGSFVPERHKPVFESIFAPSFSVQVVDVVFIVVTDAGDNHLAEMQFCKSPVIIFCHEFPASSAFSSVEGDSPGVYFLPDF